MPMGISKLSKLIQEKSKKGYKERSITYYANKKIAIDASMFIYQFLIAIRAEGGMLGAGEKTTSHLVGMFYRTISMVESGLRPVFVFDGEAPQLKLNELLKRKGRRDEALIRYEEARERGDLEKMLMYDKRRTKVMPEHINDCKRLLELMGIPMFVAPSEAEAYCAFLARKGLVDAVATEDMDALTFGTPLLLRNFTASKSKKLPIQEYNLVQILKDLGLSQEEFIDLCILLGCDFCDSIRGVGPKTALSLIKEFGSIEAILKNRENLDIPKNWNYENARLIFQSLPEGEEVKIGEIRWEKVSLDEVKSFLVEAHGFDEKRVAKGIERFFSSKRRSNQSTLDNFFGNKILQKQQ